MSKLYEVSGLRAISLKFGARETAVGTDGDVVLGTRRHHCKRLGIGIVFLL